MGGTWGRGRGYGAGIGVGGRRGKKYERRKRVNVCDFTIFRVVVILACERESGIELQLCLNTFT